LKHEWTKHECSADLEAAPLRVFKFIDLFYNTVRLHQTLDRPSPNPIEAEGDHARSPPRKSPTGRYPTGMG
jgi:hypothetical protein